jgi:hypothetical protein
MLLTLLLAVVSVAHNTTAYTHEHLHAHQNHKEDGNGRRGQGGALRLQGTFEEQAAAQHALARRHEHSHAHLGNMEDGNRRLVEGRALGLRGLQSAYEQLPARETGKESRPVCGTISPPRTGYETEELLEEPDLIFRSIVQVSVYWHSIQMDDGSGGASEDQITESIGVLNTAYESAGFQFVLKASNATKNSFFWSATQDSPAELEMKTLLGVKDCNILNIYSNGGDGQLLGWATFPQDCDFNQVYDGVVIDYTTVPGGASTGYNLGDVLVHEVCSRRTEVRSMRLTGSNAAQCMPFTPCYRLDIGMQSD